MLYLFLQRFVYRGQLAFFGTTTNPVGCAVAYRRKYVRALFDYIDPILGDDLTNSEDIFIGFAMRRAGHAGPLARGFEVQSVHDSPAGTFTINQPATFSVTDARSEASIQHGDRIDDTM